MKTAVSLPDVVFRRAERLARRQNKSRSQLYADAISEYLARHDSDQITEALNALCDQEFERGTDFAAESARQTIARETW